MLMNIRDRAANQKCDEVRSTQVIAKERPGRLFCRLGCYSAGFREFE